MDSSLSKVGSLPFATVEQKQVYDRDRRVKLDGELRAAAQYLERAELRSSIFCGLTPSWSSMGKLLELRCLPENLRSSFRYFEMEIHTLPHPSSVNACLSTL